MMPIGFHPGVLMVLVVPVVLLVVGAFVAGWAFRKGWERGGPRTERDPTSN
jgi:hypothetical protein